MRKYIRRCLPLVLLLLLATLGYALRATRATPTPCRLFPKVCQLEKQPPPCQPILCPDVDRR